MNAIQRYWQELSIPFEKELDKIRVRPSRRAVHDWRVSVKKTKAILRLLSFRLNEDAAFSFPAPLQLIYAVAGRYRDTEMSILLLHRLSRKEGILLPSFLHAQQAMLSINRKQLRQVVQTATYPAIAEIALFIEQISLSMDEEALNEKINGLATERLIEISSNMKDWKKEAHASRKKLKQVYYWLQMGDVNTLFSARQMRTLHKVLDALGHWHDHTVLHKRIRYYRKNTLIRGLEEEDACRKAEDYLEKLSEEWLYLAGEKMEHLIARK